MNYEENVNRGVKLLDATYPEWYTHIDTSQLDMAGAYSCVLGQLAKVYVESEDPDYRDYFSMLAELQLGEGEPAQIHGFEDPDGAYTPLDELWAEIIDQRNHQNPRMFE